MIGLRDNLREDAVETLSMLRTLGIKNLVMISGESKFKAQQLSDELKLDRVYARSIALRRG